MKLKAGVQSATIFIALGFASLAASIVLFVDRSSSTKLGPSLVRGIFDGFGMLWLDILFFIATFTLVHGAIGWALHWLAKPFLQQFQEGEKRRAQTNVLILLFAFLFLVLEAASRFPHTLLGGNVGDLATAIPGLILKWTLGISLTVVLGLGLTIHLARAFRKGKESRLLRILTVSLVLGAGLGAWNAAQQPLRLKTFQDRPHIILIGIDGWRLDAVPQYQGRSDIMPNVEAFFDQAAWLERTATPVARTYPSWWTILTGQYPASHGVRFNLIPDTEIRTPLRLPEQLGALGYHRIFAMDERRFANFRRSQGFDEIVGPAMGAADFVLGDLADTPLTNLLANTWIAQLLFPYIHGNRAAYKTYDPSVFDSMLSSSIDDAPHDPLFLLVHFELPHWPFKWATGPTNELYSSDFDRERAEYMEALNRADRQVGVLLDLLKQRGVLENALVVMLSDHGEGLSEDKLVWRNSESGRQRAFPAGHGNSVVAMSQHLVPLAFRWYGRKSFPAGIRTGTASLADVYPTIAELTNMSVAEPIDGRSIAEELMTDSGVLAPAAIPLETGFNTKSSIEGVLEPGRLFQEGAIYYDVLKDGRLQIRPNSLPELISSKQRAVLYGTDLFMPTGIGQQGTARGFIGDIRTHEFLIEELDGAQPYIADLNSRFCELFQEDAEYIGDTHCTSPN